MEKKQEELKEKQEKHEQHILKRPNISTKFFDETDNKKYDFLKAKLLLDNLEIISTDVNHVLSSDNFKNSWSFLVW